MSTVEKGTKAPWERSGLSRADWLLARRLASIDHMRDIALENGNERQLNQADQLEALARIQHQKRTGEFADDPTGSAGSDLPAENEPSVDAVTSGEAATTGEVERP